MKINTQNYLLYLVIFTIILLLFYYLLSDKNAIIKQLYNEFYDVKEGLANYANSGLDWTVYNNYYNDPLASTSGLTVRYSGTGAYNLINLNNETINVVQANTDRDHYFTIILTGYFVPNETGTWRFRTSSDDASFLWLGRYAVRGWNSANSIVNNGGLHGMRSADGYAYLLANEYYPIRIQMGENGGQYDLKVEWAPPSNNNNLSSNGSGILFSPGSVSSYSVQSSPEKGLLWKVYNGYFNNDVNFASKLTFKSGGIALNTGSISLITNNNILENVCITGTDPNSLSFSNCNQIGSDWAGCTGSGQNSHQFSMELLGYFYTYTVSTDPNLSWSFYLTSDDASFMWIGDYALTGYTTGNADINNGNVHAMLTKTVNISVSRLLPNKFYPIRLQFGENCGGYNFRFAWKPPGGNWTTNGDGYLYNNLMKETDNDHAYYSTLMPK